MPDFKRLLRRLLGVDSSVEPVYRWTVSPQEPLPAIPFLAGSVNETQTAIPKIVAKALELDEEDFCDAHLGIH